MEGEEGVPVTVTVSIQCLPCVSLRSGERGATAFELADVESGRKTLQAVFGKRL